MYEFRYDYVKPKYGERARLLMTDVDGLVYEIETDDFYTNSKIGIESRFDTSVYPKNHPITATAFKVGCNKKMLGTMKNEKAGKEIRVCWLES